MTQINIDYEFTAADGSHHVVALYGATPEQAAVVTWLRAEDAWKRRNDWQAKEREREAAEERKAASRAAKAEQQRAVHEAVLAGAQGFRRGVLQRHEPIASGISRYERYALVCRTCDDNKYEAQQLEFPCAEYRFARDWA